jgi:adenylate cyclase
MNIPPASFQPSASSGTRKLAAIMFTDIKDFSRRMEKDELSTMRMLTVHNTIMEETVKKYSGVVIKTVGDAFLVMFDSVVSATQCAIEVQQKFYDYNRTMKQEDDKITVRIGVHLGDVIVKDRDVFGDGVNIASRIQSLAEVGGVNISESVYQQVKHKIDIRVLDMGVPQLKGIDERVRIYQVIVIPTEKARGKLATNLYVLKTILKRKKTKQMLSLGTATTAVVVVLWIFVFGHEPPPNSIAVLPFETNEPSQQYFADQFAQDIHTYLSQLPSLRIVSIGSSFKYRNSPLSEKEIAAELDVKYLLRGRMEIEGEQVKIRARLTDPARDQDVENRNYEKSRSEIVSIQHELFRQIALRFESAFNTTREVLDLYLRALEYDRKERKEDNEVAISLLESAIQKDSNFVSAYIKLASVELLNHERRYDLSEKWLLEAEKNIQRAIHFEKDTTAEIYWLLGRLSLIRGRQQEGLEYLERSIQKNPSWMRSYQVLGKQYAFNLNDPQKAVYYWEKASELEPTNFNNSNSLGIVYAMLKKYPEAITAMQRAARLNPKHDYPWINLGRLYEITSSPDSADIAYRNALERNPTSARTSYLFGSFLLNRKDPAKAESVLSQGLKYNPKDYDLFYTYGISLIKMGKRAEATKMWENGLRLAVEGAKENPNIAEHTKFVGLFSARLGLKEQAIKNGMKAVSIDSTDNEIILGMARIYAVLGQKQEMIEWFSRARRLNPEYDEEYIKTDIDFEAFRNDPNLLFAARK